MNKQIGALWIKKDKNGNQYMSGVLEDMRGAFRIACFQNNKKTKQSQPDYHIVLSEDKKQDKKLDVPVIDISEPPVDTAEIIQDEQVTDLPF